MARPSRQIRRRTALTLPRRWPHVVGATAVLCALALGLPGLAIIFGDDDDARADGMVAVEGTRLVEASSPLDDTTALPDLLAADTLIGDNPTSAAPDAAAQANVDALGNPRSGVAPKVVTVPDRPASALAPVEAVLTRETSMGRIPGPDRTGRTPFEAYARPAKALGGRQGVAVIVGGLGINANLTRRAVDELPPDITLSFAAHAPDLQAQIDKARLAGHEVLLELPMESAGFDPSEPGAQNALRASLSEADNRRRLHRLLSRAQGYTGVINYNGDQVLSRADLAAQILGEVRDSGLAFIADGAFETPALGSLAQSLDMPFARGFGLIDPSPDRAVIQAELQRLGEASRGRPAIGVGFAYPETIDALKGWTATLSGDGLVLIPASQVLR